MGISAIIPAYNGESRFLAQAIQSVLAQSVVPQDIIVVDDASTDNTAELIARFSQVRYIRRAFNGGQAAARNDGAKMAQGQYLAFLDQDDLWEPTFLSEALAVIEKIPQAAVVHCDGYQVDEQNDILEYDAAMKHAPSITQLLRKGHDVATSGSLFRAACFEAVGGYDEDLSIWEDIDLAIRLCSHYDLVHLPKPLYRHRLYNRNASREIPSEHAIQARRHFLEKHAPACLPGTLEATALERDWAQYYSDLGKLHLHHGRYPEARQAFWLALRHEPWNRKTILRWCRAWLAPPPTTSSSPSSHRP